MKLYTSVDLRNNEVDNVKIQTTAPDPAVEGSIYYDVGTNRIKYYDGSGWIAVGSDSGGGGSGQDNVLEYVNVKVGTNSAQNLRTDSNKTVKLSFSTTGNGDLTIKDTIRNYTLGTLSLGTGSGGLNVSDFIAAGTLTSGYKAYTVKHNLGTDAVLVQVVDNSGNTVQCDVRRYTSGTDHFVEISFAQDTSQNYKLVIVGNPNYSSVNVTPITT